MSSRIRWAYGLLAVFGAAAAPACSTGGSLRTAEWGTIAATAPERYEPEREGARIPRQPYTRYRTRDAFGRTITFYLSEEPRDAPPLPLVAYVHGSGAQSHFRQADGRVRGATGHNPIADVVSGRARLVIIEKPGVAYLDEAPRGGAGEASAVFRAEHTLERWSEAVHAAIEAARRLPEVKSGRVLVIGHSEGGIVASTVAANHPWVTHIAVLAGGGPTQLFDLLRLARSGAFFTRVSDDADEREAHVRAEWARILADPDNPDKAFFGHPYRRWSSFLQRSTAAQLLRSEARVYLAQGSADAAVARASFDMMHAELLVHGRDPRVDLVDGADHSFALEHDGERVDGWTALMGRIVEWFLADRPDGGG